MLEELIKKYDFFVDDQGRYVKIVNGWLAVIERQEQSPTLYNFYKESVCGERLKTYKENLNEFFLFLDVDKFFKFLKKRNEERLDRKRYNETLALYGGSVEKYRQNEYKRILSQQKREYYDKQMQESNLKFNDIKDKKMKSPSGQLMMDFGGVRTERGKGKFVGREY